MAKRKKKNLKRGTQAEQASKSTSTQSEFPRFRRAGYLFLACVVLVAMVGVGYAPAFQADFVNFDDAQYIGQNPHLVDGLTAESVRWAFTEFNYASNWHPLTWLSHAIDISIFGKKPMGHHVVNIALHAVNVVLLFLMLRSLTGHGVASFMVAALFAIHPINVESVAWISQRKTTLSTLFGILCIWAYASYVRQKNWKLYVGSLLMFALSLMAKPMLVTMPFALLLLDYWPLYREPFSAEDEHSTSHKTSIVRLIQGWLKLLPDKLPFLALAVGVSAMTLLAQQQAMNAIEKYPLSARLANISVSYVNYLALMGWPTKLAVFYPLYAEQITGVQIARSLLLLAALSGVAVWFGRTRRYLLVGWLWYVGTMVPVIGFVHVGAQSMADRYAYIPFWGLWFALIWFVRDVLSSAGSKIGQQAVILAAGGMLVGLTFLTYRQSATWRDTMALFENAAEKTQRNWLAHCILADQNLAVQDYDRVFRYCQNAKPWGKELHRLLSSEGRALHETGHSQRGLELLREAVRLKPEMPLMHVNLGWVLAETRQFEEADLVLSEAARLLAEEPYLDPTRVTTTYANWGIALVNLGRLDEALSKFEFALRTDANNLKLMKAAANIEIQLKRFDSARERLSHVFSVDGMDDEAFLLAAKSFKDQGNLPEAVAVLQALVGRIPHHYEARMQIAELWSQAERHEAAREQLHSLLRELSGIEDVRVAAFFVRLHSLMAESYAAENNFVSAVESAKLARSLAQQLQDQAAIANATEQLKRFEQAEQN